MAHRGAVPRPGFWPNPPIDGLYSKSSRCRTLRDRASGVNGFGMKSSCASPPGTLTSSREPYPDV
jgi:hypothetical protein